MSPTRPRCLLRREKNRSTSDLSAHAIFRRFSVCRYLANWWNHPSLNHYPLTPPLILTAALVPFSINAPGRESSRATSPDLSRAPVDYYVPTLDGWRAIAIFLVILCHASPSVFGPEGSHPWPRLAAKLWWGGYGVDIFFGISGLLICGRLLRERRERGYFSLREFYVRRVFRIIPPAAVYILTLSFFVLGHRIQVRPIELLSCIFFFRNYLPENAWSFVTAHFWSLAVEEHFYLLWPGFLAFLGNRRARVCVIPIAIAIGLWRFGLMRYYYCFHVPVNFFARSDIRLDAPLWGCWAALLIDSGWTKLLTSFLTTPVSIVLGLICTGCIVFSPPFSQTLFAAAIPFILLSTVLHPHGLPARVLELPLLKWVGQLSYSLYIWQQVFLVWPTYPRPLPFGWLQAWPVNFVAIFMFAATSYYVIEKPAIGLGRRVVRGLQQPGALSLAGDR